MTASRPARPNLALAVAIWLLIVGCFGAFGLISAAALNAAHAGIAPMPPLQLALSVLSVLLALGGGITLLQMKPLAGHLLIGRFLVELVLVILVFHQSIPVPANISGNANATTVVAAAKTFGKVVSIFLLLLNLAIALYARNVTTPKAAAAEPAPPAAA